MLDSDLVAKHDKAGEVGALQRRFRPGPPEFPLHIMALGDFITVGAQAAPGDPGDAYRRNLRDYMRSIGWEVDMVGSKRSGSMKDKVCPELLSRLERHLATDIMLIRTMKLWKTMPLRAVATA